MICAIWSELVSFFLWHLTWGWRQLFMHMLFLWFFLVIVIPMSWFRSLIYSIILHVATSTWIGFLLGFLVLYVCQIPVIGLERYSVVYSNIYMVTLSFAAVYNLCLYGTALLLHGVMPIPRSRLIVALFLSGVTSALLVTRFITFG